MPIIFFLLLTGFINSFQAFNHIYVMQTSSAGDSMDVVTVEIFDHFWGRVKYGYAAAEGVVIFFLLNVLFKSSCSAQTLKIIFSENPCLTRCILVSLSQIA